MFVVPSERRRLEIGSVSLFESHGRSEDPGMTYRARSLLQTEKGDANDEKEIPTSLPDRECEFDDDVPELVSIQTWRTEKQSPRESITLMTQLSDDRYVVDSLK